MDHHTRTELITLLKSHALRTGRFKLASGKMSHYYLDGRMVTLSGEGAGLIGTAICQTLGQFNCKINAVGGLTLGADPIVGATLACSGILYRHPLRGFLVRKEPKQHGTGKLIEGLLYEGDTVVILEDVTTTGASALKAIEAVRSVGAVVVGVISLIDRLEGAAEVFKNQSVIFKPLFTIRDLGVEPLDCIHSSC